MLRKYFLNKIFIVSGSIVFIFSSCLGMAYAKRFYKDEHEVEILWKQKGKNLKAWGKVTGGESTCVQMNISIRFKNSITGRSAYFDSVINNYRPTGRNNYSGKSKIYISKNKSSISKSSKNKWYVKYYDIDCLN